jgi:hypothetical protein
MHGHTAEVLRPGLLVQPEQMVRVEFGGLPVGNNVLIADLRGVAVDLQVILILLVALYVHVAGVLVSIFDP